ncbi:hypothetical protein L0Y65_05185 [Candidatus Micrarchaeota archaeon]|nr:hypothetical protein [Candidatus Micrarchaeota archaeon]
MDKRGKGLSYASLILPGNALRDRERLAMPQVRGACAVFLDISGYTPFAESIIKAHGERGIGAIVDALEGMFGPISEIALRHGGNVIAIEGDAMLISFGGVRDALGFCGEAHPCRKKTLKALGNVFPLQIDIGLAEGRLYEFIAQDGDRRAYLSCGSALREAAGHEKHSKNGSVSTNLAREPDGKSRHSQIRGEDLHAKYLAGRGGLLKRLFRREGMAAPAPDEEYAKSFLPQSLHEAQQCRLLSPVAIFSDFPFMRMAFSRLSPNDGSAPDAALAHDALTDFFACARNIFEVQADGFIGKLKDENSLILIGAPRSCDDARVRAFEAVAKMHETHDRLCRKYGFPALPAVTGMHKGEALCGPILGRYDAIGETINLASRIKSSVQKHGHGEGRRRIRFSREMLDERVSRMIRGYEIGRERLAGIEETKTLFFDFATAIGKGEREEFVLHSKELEKICRMVRERDGIALNVIGEAGSGRDRLLSLVAEEFAGECHELRCSPLFKKDPYRALLELMKKVGGFYSDGELFNWAGEGDFPAMLARFQSRLVESPAIYIINNGDNIDRESAAFFAAIGQDFAKNRCSAIYSGSSRLFPDGEDFEVNGLLQEEAHVFARQLAKKHHPGARLPDAILGEVFAKSGGSPQFISELVKAMEDDGLGRLRFRRRMPEGLRDIMLSNLHVGLSPALYEALETYSLMHSTAVMAPLVDGDARENLDILRDKGFLGADYEFVNAMLQGALSDSMDPRKKERISLRLAEAAEAAGMKNGIAIFEYYRNAERTPENRAKALMHAERHVNSVSFFYLIRNEFFDDAIMLADLSDQGQMRICGNMLHRKAYLISKLGNDRKTIEKNLELLEKAFEYLAGSGEGYKILTQMGAATCRLGRLEIEEGNMAGGDRRLGEGKRLFERAREEALKAGRVDAYLAISNSFSGNLTIYCKEPRAALELLEETGAMLGTLAPLPKTPQNQAFLAMLDKMHAEAAKELGMYDVALDKLADALAKSEEAGYSQGVLYCRATEAQVYLRMGELDDAERLAGYCMDFMRDNNLEDAEVKKDMDAVLEDVETLRKNDRTGVSWPNAR